MSAAGYRASGPGLQLKGALPDEYLERFSIDRIGFGIAVRKTLQKLEEVSKDPLTNLTATFMEMPHVRREIEASPDGGIGIIRDYYEGLLQDNKEPVEETEGFFEQVPLQSHPNFKFLFDKYGGYFTANGNLRWPPNPNATSSSGLTSTTSDGKSLAGAEGFLRMGCTVRKIYAAKVAPTGIFSKVGSISSPEVKKVVLPPTGKRNFLYAPPKLRWRGNAFEITQEWMYSGLGGWMTDIYDGSTEGNK
jgi:hypothetical protein